MKLAAVMVALVCCMPTCGADVATTVAAVCGMQASNLAKFPTGRHRVELLRSDGKSVYQKINVLAVWSKDLAFLDVAAWMNPSKPLKPGQRRVPNEYRALLRGGDLSFLADREGNGAGLLSQLPAPAAEKRIEGWMDFDQRPTGSWTRYKSRPWVEMLGPHAAFASQEQTSNWSVDDDGVGRVTLTRQDVETGGKSIGTAVFVCDMRLGGNVVSAKYSGAMSSEAHYRWRDLGGRFALESWTIDDRFADGQRKVETLKALTFDYDSAPDPAEFDQLRLRLREGAQLRTASGSSSASRGVKVDQKSLDAAVEAARSRGFAKEPK